MFRLRLSNELDHRSCVLSHHPRFYHNLLEHVGQPFLLPKLLHMPPSISTRRLYLVRLALPLCSPDFQLTIRNCKWRV